MNPPEKPPISQANTGLSERSGTSPKTRRPPPGKRQATPVELAALMVETVCVPASSERETLQELAEFLEVERGSMESELMFLRAFAVDFATGMMLGDSPERLAISERFFGHWEAISDQAGTDVLDDLQERIRYYTEVIHSPDAGYQGLAGQVGFAFAGCCQASGGAEPQEEPQEEDGREELAMLGGAMFAALFDEVSEILSGLDILLYDP